MITLTKLDIIFLTIMILLGIVIIILIIILFVKRPKELKGINGDDITISYFSSLNFSEIDSLPVYSESGSNLGSAGRLILDCFTGLCQVEDYYLDDYDDTIYYDKDVIDYNCSKQCSYNISKKCNCDDSYKWSIGECSRLYDDSYDERKYCYADNIIYNWKGKKYDPEKKNVLTYYNNAKLKEEECPIGTVNCGIIDDNENKLCISSGNCPINYFSDNKLNSNKIHSIVNIGNKTFYYTFDEDNKMKRKIIGGLVSDSDLYLNNDNKEKVLIDTGTISEFLADNKNLYKEVNLGYDPYKAANIDNKGKSYLRYYYNNKVDLKKLRRNINIYNKKNYINKEIDEIRKMAKNTMIFGLISYISFLIPIILFVTSKNCGDKALKVSAAFTVIFIIIFVVFYYISFVYICINISKFNELDDLYEDADNLPRIINLIILILYLILFVFIIFLIVYFRKLRDKWVDNKKSEGNDTTVANEKISENQN